MLMSFDLLKPTAYNVLSMTLSSNIYLSQYEGHLEEIILCCAMNHDLKDQVFNTNKLTFGKAVTFFKKHRLHF